MKFLFAQSLVGAAALFAGVFSGLLIWTVYRPEIRSALLTLQNMIFG